MTRDFSFLKDSSTSEPLNSNFDELPTTYDSYKKARVKKLYSVLFRLLNDDILVVIYQLYNNIFFYKCFVKKYISIVQ